MRRQKHFSKAENHVIKFWLIKKITDKCRTKPNWPENSSNKMLTHMQTFQGM